VVDEPEPVPEPKQDTWDQPIRPRLEDTGELASGVA
jgi:hypothetical protein